MKTISSQEHLTLIVKAASEKKALDIVAIDMHSVPTVCDYFVVSSGTSTTHVQAIAENIAKRLKETGMRVRHIEGMGDASWILLDCGDVIAHVFLEPTRDFYGLERLWGSLPQKRYKEKRRKVSGVSRSRVASSAKKRPVKKAMVRHRRPRRRRA